MTRVGRTPGLRSVALLAAGIGWGSSACREASPPVDPPGVEPPAPPLTDVREYPTAQAAFRAVLDLSPRALAVGEYHATVDGPAVPSALERFTRELLPALPPDVTDLVLETWILEGRCGEAEATVAERVPEDTRRPEATGGELEALVAAVVARGIRPHVVPLGCDDYAALLDERGEVVYARLLALLAERMGALGVEGLRTPDARVVLYSGAVHNDLVPAAALASWSFGPALVAAGGDAVVELDLVVPEGVAGVASLSGEPWFPLVARAGDRALLWERAPRSFVLVFPVTR